jgi:hypothetical protein
MIIGIIITLIVVILIAILWVRGIDNMKKNHPDYKGEDFLDWDDNKIHSEGNF